MTFLMMGETDYKDENWTEKDFEELHQASLEGKRRIEEARRKAGEPVEQPASKST